MGAWGPALFSDDTATDGRDDYRDHVGDGLSGSAATDRLLSEWRSTLSDPDEGPVFWLALAATQWKCGRLEPRVLEKALEVISTGAVPVRPGAIATRSWVPWSRRRDHAEQSTTEATMTQRQTDPAFCNNEDGRAPRSSHGHAKP